MTGVEQQVSSLARQVEAAVSAALRRVRPELAGADPLVRRSDRADFQSNVALASAKRAQGAPRAIWPGDWSEALHGASTGSPTSRSPAPGSSTSRSRTGRSGASSTAALADDRLGVDAAGAGCAGGDRLLGAQHRQGDARRPPAHDDHRRRAGPGAASSSATTVIRQNHLGDWGTQFGMLIQYLDEHPRRAVAPRPTRSARATVVDGLRAGRAVPRGARRVRRRPGVRRPGPGPGGRAAGRRPGDDSGALARDRRRVRDRRSGRSTTGSACCWSRATPRASPPTTQWLPEVVEELVAAGVAVPQRRARSSSSPTRSRPRTATRPR